MPERILKISKSTRKGKKYTATVGYKGKTRKVHFGSTGYSQYKDSTPLKLYKSKDHKDPKRRQRYFLRHSKVKTKSAALKKEYGSRITPKFLAHKYLW